jgi:hypothetical protein
MTTHLVYAETSIWNELCNQAMDPHRVATRFAGRGEQLTLGLNVFFELVKTFGKREEGAANRGSELFSYLRSWMHDDFPIIRQTPEILAEEVMHSLGGSTKRRVFVEGVEHRIWTEEIARLANGGFASPRDKFIELRKATVKRSRDEMRNDFGAIPEAKPRLQKISIVRLKNWLIEEARSMRGVDFLARQLVGALPGESLPKLCEVADGLLASDEYKLSHALVKNGLFLNWCLANRGSVPTSSFDDAYHVVNASYCNKFLTTDKNQAEQASYSLAGVQVGYCEPNKPFERWLTDNGY